MTKGDESCSTVLLPDKINRKSIMLNVGKL